MEGSYDGTDNRSIAPSVAFHILFAYERSMKSDSLQIRSGIVEEENCGEMLGNTLYIARKRILKDTEEGSVCRLCILSTMRQ